MFEMPQGISERDALAKMKASRDTDSTTEQPENLDAVNVSEDAPIEAEEANAQAEALEAEIEGSEQQQPESSDEVSAAEELFYDFEGEEVSQSQLKEWRDNGLMQADYTRKTQEHAKNVKAFEAKQEKLDSALAQLEAVIAEEQATPEQIAEWREYEPEKLLDYQDKMSKRQELLNSAKDAKSNPEPVQHDYTKLLESNPAWVSNGQTTDAYNKDMQAMTKYAESRGMSAQEASQLSPAHLQILLDATRGQQALNKGKAMAKQVRKAPVSTKPKAAAQTSIVSEIQKLEKKVKQYGRETDFVQLRKLKRQLNSKG